MRLNFSHRRVLTLLFPLLVLTLCAASCGHPEQPDMLSVIDVHSLSNPLQVRITTVDLDLHVHFDLKVLSGTAVLGFTPIDRNATHLVLDTRKLLIDKVEISEDQSRWAGNGVSISERKIRFWVRRSPSGLLRRRVSCALPTPRAPALPGCNGSPLSRPRERNSPSFTPSPKPFMRAAGFRFRTRPACA